MDIFHAFNTDQDDNTLSKAEMSYLMTACSDWAQEHNAPHLILAVRHTVDFQYSDADLDCFLDIDEFLAGF